MHYDRRHGDHRGDHAPAVKLRQLSEASQNRHPDKEKSARKNEVGQGGDNSAAQSCPEAGCAIKRHGKFDPPNQQGNNQGALLGQQRGHERDV